MCHALAKAYSRGTGVAQNHAKAHEMWQLAARSKHSPSCVELGYAALEGRGTPKDETMAIDWWRKALEMYDRRPVPPPSHRCHRRFLYVSVFIHLRNDEKADYVFGRAIAEGRFSDDTIDKHFGGKDEAMHEAARLLKNAAARGHVQDIERHLTLIAEHLNKVFLNIVLRCFTARVVTTFHGSDDRLLIFY